MKKGLFFSVVAAASLGAYSWMQMSQNPLKDIIINNDSLPMTEIDSNKYPLSEITDAQLLEFSDAFIQDVQKKSSAKSRSSSSALV